jgi:hypothetical protein
MHAKQYYKHHFYNLNITNIKFYFMNTDYLSGCDMT